MYGETSFSNQNNFRRRDFAPSSGRNNFGATGNSAERNRNFNYNRGHGFASNNYRNDHFSSSNNMARFEGHNDAPMSRPGTNQAHDDNRRDIRERNYNPRPIGNGYVQNGVYHHRENASPPNTGTFESGRSQGGNVQAGVRKVWVVANASSDAQGRSNENLDALNNCEPEISNLVNNAETSNNQGN